MPRVRVTGAPALCAVVLGDGLGDEDRLKFYAAVMGLRAEGPDGAPVLDLGAADDLAVELANLVMAGYGLLPADRVRARLGSLRVAADSRLRARQAPRAGQRVGSGDVQVKAQKPSHAGFFGVDVVSLSHRRFDGQMSPILTREIFVAGDAVTVLPYDPLRDRVLLVEQFRTGPLGRGDPFPWQLEAIAGRIDPGETPEAAARREAEEEAGLTLGAMEKVAEYYPSPGAVAEYLYSYVALCDLPDGCAGVFGAEEEAEDIQGHLISFDRLVQLMDEGEIGNAPLLLTVLWLQRERARLRG